MKAKDDESFPDSQTACCEPWAPTPWGHLTLMRPRCLWCPAGICCACVCLPAQSCLTATPWTAVRQMPLSLGILQAKMLEWVAMPSPGDLPGIEPRSPALQADSLPAETQGKPKNTGIGSLSFLQGIFPTQESNRSHMHCRRILYQLSYQESHFRILPDHSSLNVWS